MRHIRGGSANLSEEKPFQNSLNRLLRVAGFRLCQCKSAHRSLNAAPNLRLDDMRQIAQRGQRLILTAAIVRVATKLESAHWEVAQLR